MKLLGIVSILLFLSFIGTILNLLLFYLSPLISNVQCYFDDFLHQFIIKAGLMFIAFQMIIATILHKSSSLPSNEISGRYVSYDLCLLKQKDGKEDSSNENFDDDGEFSLQEMKQVVVEEKTYGIKENDAYPKDDEEKRNESENNGVSGDNVVNVEGHSLDENLPRHEMKKKVELEKKGGIGDPHNNCENDDCLVEDAEEKGGSGEDEDVKILERRIEEFIARSHQRWKEELEDEKLNLLTIVNDSSYYLRNRVTEAQQRKIMPRTSKPKNANNISKKQRLHTIWRLIENMQTKAKMIKMRSHPISTKIRFPVNICHPTLPRVHCPGFLVVIRNEIRKATHCT